MPAGAVTTRRSGKGVELIEPNTPVRDDVTARDDDAGS